MRTLLALLLLLSPVMGSSPASAAPAGEPAAESAWEVLAEARRALTGSGALVAEFTQTYTPSGFSSGDSESGILTLGLPDCLRWDYAEPFPKSFLLCGVSAYSWNPGETSGRFQRIDPAAEPGLDLLLLATDELRERYRAENLERPDGVAAVRLEPLVPEAVGIRQATLVFDAGDGRLGRLRYADIEGNLTEFDLAGYRIVEVGNRFDPPDEVTWQEE